MRILGHGVTLLVQRPRLPKSHCPAPKLNSPSRLGSSPLASHVGFHWARPGPPHGVAWGQDCMAWLVERGSPRGAPRRPSNVQGRGPKQPSKRDSWAAFAGLLPAGRNRNGKTSVIAYRPIECVRHLRRGHVADGVTEMQSSSWHPPSASTASAW